MSDIEAQRQRGGGRDQHRDHGIDQVFEETVLDRQRTSTTRCALGRVGQPAQCVQKQVHVLTLSWQSIIVWFLGAALIHDLVFFPLYALADRVIRRGAHATKAPRATLNHLRIPLLAVGMPLLIFFPGIFQQGKDSSLRATGPTQDPFLERWLRLSAAIFALAYACRLAAIRGSSGAPDR